MEWHASWIWTAEDPALPNRYMRARRAFVLDDVPSEAVVHCCADSRYCFYVNGHFVGRGPARYHVSTPSYDTYDIAPYLQTGENVLAFLVHHLGCPVFNFMPVRGALIGQAAVQGVDLSTGPEWRVCPAEDYQADVPRLCAQQGYPEIRDTRREPVGWEHPGYDDSGWESATVLGPAALDPWQELEPRGIPHLYEMPLYPESVREVGHSVAPAGMDPMAPGSVAQLVASGHHIGLGSESIRHRCAALAPDERETIIQPGAAGEAVYMVVDFAREVAGYPVLVINGADGAIVDIAYSEALVDGRVDCCRQQLNYADRVILRDGLQTYEPVMPRAFRFMHIEVRNASRPIGLRAVYVSFCGYPVEYYGSFESSDPVLNQIWDIGTYTTQLCMEDAYIDCPWRERGQWWGDARIQALITYYAFGDTRLMRRGLRQIAQSQRPDGLVHACYPAATDQLIPDFACLWIISLWEHYLYSGDGELLAELMPAVARVVGWFESRIDAHGVLGNVPHWVFIDWADVDKRGEVAALNCFYLGALRHAELIASATGRGEQAAHYHHRAQELRQAIRERFLCPERGALVDCREGEEWSAKIGQQANALAVLFGVFDNPEEASRALEAVREPSPGVVQVGSPYFSFYLLQALYQQGQHEAALDYIRQRWGAMLDAGATTCWETWRPVWSLCHAWSGGPTYDLSAEFLGVRPLRPGYATFAVRPRCAGVRWMKGIVPSPHGEIAASWVGDPAGDAFTLHSTVPEGTVGRLCIPEITPNHWETIELNGALVWRAGGLGAAKPEVRSAWSERGYIVFELEPGNHTLQARA